MKVSLIFVESICDDPDILERNILSKVKNDDYRGMNQEVALSDFRNRLLEYEKVYQPIQDSEVENNGMSYIKLYNVGKKVTTLNCNGYLLSNITFYLSNI